MVTLKTTIHDGSIALLRNALLGNLGIDPIGETPHLRANLAKLDGGGCVVLNGVLERLVEVAIVQKDVWVVVPAIEVALDGLERLDNAIQFLVPGQDDEDAVGARLGSVGLETALDEDLVILLADFSVRWPKSACRPGKARLARMGLTL